MAAKRYLVRGRVQGVGYRYFAQSAAVRSGVAGFVRNLPDGSVEVHASGEAEALRRLRAELERGPRAAAVEGVLEEDIAPSEPYESFIIRG